jgi:hypothetical protein
VSSVQEGGAKFKSITVSLIMPVSFLLGGGAISAMIGLIGQTRSFATGFIILRGMLLGGAILAGYLKLTKD